VGAFLTAETAKEAGAMGVKFAWADDVEEAAGILKLDVVHQGKGVFHEVITALKTSGIPHPKEKIEMILQGEYRGIPLIVDKVASKPHMAVGWKPSKKNAFQLWKAHKSKSCPHSLSHSLFSTVAVAL